MNAPTTRETADHAELAAKAERCTTGDPWYKDDDLRGRQTFGQFLPQDRAFIAAANPATVLALLSEIAALRAMVENAADGSMGQTDKLLTMHERATQAERQRDEAAGLLRRYRSDLPTEALEDLTDAFLANQGADQ